MDSISRRNMLMAAGAGGLLTAATAASAQSNEPLPQPQRPGHGGTDPGPRDVVRDRQNPDILVPPSTDHGTLPNLRFSFADRIAEELQFKLDGEHDGDIGPTARRWRGGGGVCVECRTWGSLLKDRGLAFDHRTIGLSES